MNTRELKMNILELSVVKTQIHDLRKTLKQLEKQLENQLENQLEKNVKKRRGKLENRAPSGFTKPTKISKELCEFIGKNEGTEIARTEVTMFLNTYIRKNKLQEIDNGRKIVPDEKLKILLDIKHGEELTYFNLQRYLSKHFIKSKV
jgi:upstream activation factor subunit UAF30